MFCIYSLCFAQVIFYCSRGASFLNHMKLWCQWNIYLTLSFLYLKIVWKWRFATLANSISIAFMACSLRLWIFLIGPLFWNTKKHMGCGADTGHRVWCGRCLYQVIVVLAFHIGSVSLLCSLRWLLAFWYLQFWHCRTDGFTETREWILLDCLDLNLRHGWIAAGVSKFIMSTDYVVSADFLIQCAIILYEVASSYHDTNY